MGNFRFLPDVFSNDISEVYIVWNLLEYLAVIKQELNFIYAVDDVEHWDEAGREALQITMEGRVLRSIAVNERHQTSWLQQSLAASVKWVWRRPQVIALLTGNNWFIATMVGILL